MCDDKFTAPSLQTPPKQIKEVKAYTEPINKSAIQNTGASTVSE